MMDWRDDPDDARGLTEDETAARDDEIVAAGPPVHICSFQSVDTPTRKTRYDELREKVLKAGRFSVFEATANDTAAAMFTRLCKDPTVETETVGFPWTAVRRKP